MLKPADGKIENEGNGMNFSTQLETVLAAVRKRPAWDMATTYSLEHRPDFVVFHNGFKSAAAVLRSVVANVSELGPQSINALAESIVDLAMGTEHGKTLCPHGVDPDHPEPILIDSEVWHAKPPEEKDRIFSGSQQPIFLTKDEGQEAPPACEPPGVTLQPEYPMVVEATPRQAAFIARENLEGLIGLMEDRPEFNASIGYVREALAVCPPA